jgi:DNA invertase Pin-like site-specific DNA recombinase
MTGYARVSTDGQSLSAQLAELKAAKCAKIFQEKISGARSDRKQLTRLMAALARGDVLVITRLDRLARSTRDLLNLLGTIAEKGAGFKSLRDAWADTTTAHGRLMLTILGGLAEFERELIRTRTGEGRERAKARGVVLGRKPKLTLHQRREAITRRDERCLLTLRDPTMSATALLADLRNRCRLINVEKRSCSSETIPLSSGGAEQPSSLPRKIAVEGSERTQLTLGHGLCPNDF